MTRTGSGRREAPDPVVGLVGWVADQATVSTVLASSPYVAISSSLNSRCSAKPRPTTATRFVGSSGAKTGSVTEPLACEARAGGRAAPEVSVWRSLIPIGSRRSASCGATNSASHSLKNARPDQ